MESGQALLVQGHLLDAPLSVQGFSGCLTPTHAYVCIVWYLCAADNEPYTRGLSTNRASPHQVDTLSPLQQHYLQPFVNLVRELYQHLSTTMYYRSAILVAASSLLFCVNLTQGFMPAPPTVQSSKAVSAQVAEPLVAPVNAVMKGGQPVNSDKPKLKLPNTCDSDYECDGTEFCCDFMFFKMCCSDGKPLAHDCTCLLIAPYIAQGLGNLAAICS